MVGFTPSGKLILLILTASPISLSLRSNINLSGILFALHLSSTSLRTIFNTPPFFNPGDFSEFINLTGISKVILEP